MRPNLKDIVMSLPTVDAHVACHVVVKEKDSLVVGADAAADG